MYWWWTIFSQRWVQGFPKQNVHFVNDSTICYPCGNFIIFINIETKKKTVLQCMNGVVGVVATNPPYEVVAFSDRKLRPIIYIYNFPGLTRRTKLKGILQAPSSAVTERFCYKMWPDLVLINEGFWGKGFVIHIFKEGIRLIMEDLITWATALLLKAWSAYLQHGIT